MSSLDQASESIDVKRINRESVQRTIGEIVDNFNPNDRVLETTNARYRIPWFQRYAKWNVSEKESLISSVMQNRTFGSIILIERVDPVTKQVYYDIEDGQSRLNVIYQYYNNEFKWNVNDADSRTYTELPETHKIAFKTYSFSVDIIRDVSDKEIIDIFQNLNSGKMLVSKDWYHARSRENRVVFTVKLYNSNPKFKKFIGDNFTSSPNGRNGLDVFTCINISIARRENDRLSKNFRANCQYLDETHSEQLIKDFWEFFFEITEEATEDLVKFRRSGKSSMKFYIPLVLDWNADSSAARDHKHIWVKYMKYIFQNGANSMDKEVFTGLKNGSVYSESTRFERLEKIMSFFGGSANVDEVGVEMVPVV